MRNLKRALSLGLTAAMISGLMVMGSSAAGSSYTDVADTDNVEAIEVLKAVGIMVGDESGNFNPDQQVTRNEMAVVMSNLMAYNVATYKNTSPFTDVPSWAEPYVAACYTNGITAGYSDTIYGGNDTVTTAQAALMVMKALGYFQYSSDFGSDWQLATVSQGNRIDLFTDVDSGVRDAMTRNDVAQLVLNALECGTVEPETNGSISVGDITIVNDVRYNYVTSGQDYARTIKKTLNTSNDGVYSEGSIVELGEKLYQGDLTQEDFVEEGYTDVFGHPATRWEYQAKEVGTFTEGASTTFSDKVTSKELYDAVGKTATDNYSWHVEVDGKAVSYDGDTLSANKSDNNDDFLKEAGMDEYGTTGNGVRTEVYVDGTKGTVYVALTHFYAAEVYDVNEDSITLSNVNSYDSKYDTADIDDEFETTGFAEDDIVMYSFANNEIQEVYAADQVTGEVTRVRADSADTNGDYFIADGTTYNYNTTLPEDERLVTENVNNDVVAYADQYGYVAYIDESAITYDYAYVLSMGTDGDQYGDTSSSTVYARLVLTDGTMVKVETDAKTSEIGKSDGKGGYEKTADGLLNHIVSYTVDKNDVYTLSVRDVDTDDNTQDPDNITGTNGIQKVSGDELKIDNSVASFDATSSKDYTANSNTVFIVADKGEDMDSYDFYVYTGIKNVPDIKGNASGTVVAVAADGNDVAKVVYIQDADVAGSGDVIFALADKDPYLVRDKETGDYYEFDAIREGEVITLNVKTGSDAAEKLMGDTTRSDDAFDLNNDEVVALNNSQRIVALESVTENSDGLVTNVRLYEGYDATVAASGDRDGVKSYTGGTGKAQNETVALGGENGPRYAWYDDADGARYDSDAEEFKSASIGGVKDDKNDKALAVFDSGVLAGLCVVEYPNDSNSSTPSGDDTDSFKNGDATLVVNGKDLTADSVRVSGQGALSWTFGTKETGSVSYDYVITVEGSTVARGTLNADVIDGQVLGNRALGDEYSKGDEVVVTISDVAAVAEDITLTFKGEVDAYNFFTTSEELRAVAGARGTFTVTVPAGESLIIESASEPAWTEGSVYDIGGNSYKVDATGSLEIPAADLENMSGTLTITVNEVVVIDPESNDVIAKLLEEGNATVIGNVPAGTYNTQSGTLTLKDATIEKGTEITVGGNLVIEGTVTVAGTINMSSFTVADGATLVIENVDGMKIGALEVQAGGAVNYLGFVYTAEADVYMNFLDETVNGEIPFGEDMTGILGGLNTARDAGLMKA